MIICSESIAMLLAAELPRAAIDLPLSRAEIMKFQIGAMSVGDILDRGLKLFLARLPALYLINLIVLSPVIGYQLLLPLLLMEGENGAGAAAAVGILGGALLILFLTLVLQPIGSAAILHIISQEFVDRHVGIGSAFGFALPRFGSLLGASILVGFITGFGFLFCLVPGFMFMTWYAFFAQVIVVEGLSASASMDRSKQLGQGYRWRIFGIILLIGLLTNVIPSLLNLGLEAILPASETVPTEGGGSRVVPHLGNQAIHTLVTQLVTILFAAYQAVCMTLLYFDLRIRKEGYDLELAAESQQDTPPEDVIEAELDNPES